jgi:hypothetical protein
MVRFPGFFMDGEAMKTHISFSMHRWFSGMILFGAIFCICIFTAGDAGGTTEISDEPISLNLENRPLGEVLEAITEITGHTFIINEEWLDFPVSLRVNAVPLHRVLKLIFANLNNAIIYKSDGSIKILVYAESVSSHTGSASQAEEPVPETRYSQEMEPETDAPEPADQEGEREDITEARSKDESASGEEQTSKTDEESEEKNGTSTQEGNDGQGEGTQETSEN